MSLWSRMANVFRGDQAGREIDEEFQSHLAESVERGRDPREAQRAQWELEPASRPRWPYPAPGQSSNE